MDNGNGLKNSLLKELRVGQRRAIPGSLLAKRLGFKNDRVIRLAIRELTVDGIPVVSSIVPPMGFYIAETKEEVNKYAANMRSRLIETALHRRDLLRASRSIRQPEQMRLKL